MFGTVVTYTGGNYYEQGEICYGKDNYVRNRDGFSNGFI